MSARRSSAKQRIVDALLTAGTGGRTTAELCHPAVGGERFGARIHELRQAGYTIREKRLRAGSSLYVLVGVGADAAPGSTDAPVVVGTTSSVGPEAHPDPWRRVWLCPRCAYKIVAGETCDRGHQAKRGWHLDQRDLFPAVVETESDIAEAA